MVNFFTKKLNKKGFTLAELLIVVAIIAILIAIAVPIYTSALKDAQIKVNLANARTLKGAAVSYILSHWTETDGATGDHKYSDGSTDGTQKNGWIAIGTYDSNGDISAMHVGVLTSKVTATGKYFVYKTSAATGPAISDVLDGGALTGWVAIDSSKGTGATANPNTVCAVITQADVQSAKSA